MNASRLPRPAWARDRRVGLGVVAVVVALVLLGVGALLGGWRPFSDEPRVVTFGPGGDLQEFTLFDGQCATGSLGPGGSFGVESDAQCGTPHDVEVVSSRAPLNESREVEYPGEAAMARFGRAYCELVGDSALLRPESDGVRADDLTITAVIPAEAAFLAPRTAAASSSGARQVSCVITRSDGEKLTDRFSVI